jgi:hypothetical protein
MFCNFKKICSENLKDFKSKNIAFGFLSPYFNPPHFIFKNNSISSAFGILHNFLFHCTSTISKIHITSPIFIKILKNYIIWKLHPYIILNELNLLHFIFCNLCAKILFFLFLNKYHILKNY